jgi:DNA-binding IclR family transcriptional regulator
MDDDLLQEMIRDLHETIGFVPIPENAMQCQDLADETGKPYETIRRALKELVDSGRWQKQRSGQQTYFWKVKED